MTRRVGLLPCLAALLLPAGVSSREGCGLCDQRLVLNFTTDGFPEETSWVLSEAKGGKVDCSDEVFAVGEDYSSPQSTYSLLVSDSLCALQNYTFTFSDSFGDGICCLYGPGGWSLWLDKALIFERSGSADFYFDVVTFTVPVLPTPLPSEAPTPLPSPPPTPSPTGSPQPTVTPVPSSLPSLSFWPTSVPSPRPSPRPSPAPSVRPSSPPTPLPTTVAPSPAPTLTPTTNSPSNLPSQPPSPRPSASPSTAPTSSHPTPEPSFVPLPVPSALPTPGPSPRPSPSPTLPPTLPPTLVPTRVPSGAPSLAPTPPPTSSAPSMPPSPSPSALPSPVPSAAGMETATAGPTVRPSVAPSPSPELVDDDGSSGLIPMLGRLAVPLVGGGLGGMFFVSICLVGYYRCRRKEQQAKLDSKKRKQRRTSALRQERRRDRKKQKEKARNRQLVMDRFFSDLLAEQAQSPEGGLEMPPRIRAGEGEEGHQYDTQPRSESVASFGGRSSYSSAVHPFNSEEDILREAPSTPLSPLSIQSPGRSSPLAPSHPSPQVTPGPNLTTIRSGAEALFNSSDDENMADDEGDRSEETESSGRQHRSKRLSPTPKRGHASHRPRPARHSPRRRSPRRVSSPSRMSRRSTSTDSLSSFARPAGGSSISGDAETIPEEGGSNWDEYREGEAILSRYDYDRGASVGENDEANASNASASASASVLMEAEL